MNSTNYIQFASLCKISSYFFSSDYKMSSSKTVDADLKAFVR
jgi:hypothetical protein